MPSPQRPPIDRQLCFADDLAAPTLDEGDHHHLARVLRLRPGSLVTVADGSGRWRPAVLGEGPVLEPDGEICAEPVPERPVTVAFAPVKGDRPEWAVQKLTEVGVDRIVLLEADRSVVRWSGERARRQVARLTRVAREAAMQSRRARLPAVEGPEPVGALVGWRGVALADPGGAALDDDVEVLLVGPEGGWTDPERSVGRRVSLGPTVLRTETAAVVGATLLCARRHGWATR